MFIKIFSSYSFENVENVYNSMNQITINEKLGRINLLEESKHFLANREMLNINYIYDLIRKSLIIKEGFDSEIFLKKHQIEFYQIVQDIKNKNIKEICNSFLAINHLKNKLYLISENEFRSAINYLNETEKILKIGDEYDKLRDAIKRSSTVSYLNEYSDFKNLDENFVEMIYINIYKQRFFYYYAMTKFKLGNELSINKNKKNKEKRENYFKDSIKFFQECKNINELLGINQIKIIYSLIMISKCHLYLNDYKNSITNITEALSLYFNFSTNFNHSKFYNPKIMLFIEINIFNQIFFTFSKICISFKKPIASSYLILKIFENSPFILNNIHYNAGLNLIHFLEKNKSKMNQYEKNFYKNPNLMKEYEKLKKLLAKIVSRLSIKYSNNNNLDDFNSTKISNTNKQSTIQESNKASSYNLKSDFATSKMSLYNNKNRKMNKNIMICVSEKVFEKINRYEFKDIIIKYLQKTFIPDEKDKFCYSQFSSNNGKRSLFIQPLSLKDFIKKFLKIKFNIESNDDSLKLEEDKPSLFMGLYDILYSIIKNYQTNDLNDNIIMLFMNAEDIRFSTIAECMNIVDELNKNNTSLFFFSFDEIIKNEKINNIQSFLNGLIEGYFFKIKNFEQIKEIFVYLSNYKYQSNFFRFSYDLFDQFI